MVEGKKGRKRVVNTMKLAVEQLYQYAEANKLCFKPLLYYLEGIMVPPDMSEEVMKGVVERAEATGSRLYAEDSTTKTRKETEGGRAR